MSKIKKPLAQSARAKARSAERLSAMIEREVQRRLGTKSTFEQRNNMRAEIIKEAAFRGADDDLRQIRRPSSCQHVPSVAPLPIGRFAA